MLHFRVVEAIDNSAADVAKETVEIAQLAISVAALAQGPVLQAELHKGADLTDEQHVIIKEWARYCV